jgi:hypothetical protein
MGRCGARLFDAVSDLSVSSTAHKRISLPTSHVLSPGSCGMGTELGVGVVHAAQKELEPQELSVVALLLGNKFSAFI